MTDHRRSVRGEYAALAAAYDRRWAAYNERSLALLHPFLAGRELGAVLDLGCGTGNLVARLDAWEARYTRYAGADLSVEMLLAARAKVGAGRALAAADAGALPFADGSFDTIVSASALHDWPRPGRAIAEARRVLRAGGRLIVADWSRGRMTMRAQNAWLRITGNAFHRMYSPAELNDLLQRNGFRVVREERRAISWIWELMVVEAVIASPPAR